jgi:predicted PurR-regulated permease PerM
VPPRSTSPSKGAMNLSKERARSARALEVRFDVSSPNDRHIVAAPMASQKPSTPRESRALSWFAAGAVVLIAWIARPVSVGLLLGTLLAFTLQPLYERLIARTGRPKLMATACVGGAGLGIAGAFAGVTYLIVSRGVAMAQALLSSLGPAGSARGLIQRLAQHLPQQVRSEEVIAKLSGAAEGLASRAASIAAALANALAAGLLAVFFMIMTASFILRHWELVSRRAEDMLPLARQHTHALFEEFRRVGRTTLLGTVVTGVSQGLLAAVGYWIFGVPEAAFLGALTAVASLLPGVGTLLVWVPAGAFLLGTDHVVEGVLVLVYGGAVVVGFSDYVLRPRLVGGHGAMPALLTFVSLFGGVEVFGFMGLILGPLLMSLAVALLRIYAKEVREAEVTPEPTEEPAETST